MEAARESNGTPLLVLTGRSSLAFEDLHGEPLFVHALRSLVDACGRVVVAADAGDVRTVRRDAERRRLPVTVLMEEDWWAAVSGGPAGSLVVHDVLCPLTSSDFLASMVRRGEEAPRSAFVAVRPVTDTLKIVVDGRIAGTIDRDGLASISSPVIVPRALWSGAAQPPPVADFAAMVAWLRERGDVELVRAPSLARRVEHRREVHLLECVDEMARRVRAEAGRRGSVAEDRP